jgi:hypothetical protein
MEQLTWRVEPPPRYDVGRLDVCDLLPCPESQPTLNQRYAATEREQMRLNVSLFVNVLGLFRGTRAAHNGLVAGSSPAGLAILSCTRLRVHSLPVEADGSQCPPAYPGSPCRSISMLLSDAFSSFPHPSTKEHPTAAYEPRSGFRDRHERFDISPALLAVS